jgi:hypothetical protein
MLRDWAGLQNICLIPSDAQTLSRIMVSTYVYLKEGSFTSLFTYLYQNVT